MKIEQTTYSELKAGDLFFLPTMDSHAQLLIKTDYFTQHTHDNDIVYRVTRA